MNLATAYCPTRWAIEDRISRLTDKLSCSCDRLMSLVGSDHENFLAARDVCDGIRKRLVELRSQLKLHLVEHGC